MNLFEPQQPWDVPAIANDTFFYHSIDFPDGTTAQGHWDIRGQFDDYIGYYPIAGKTVLDVGTATGFLAFSAEKAGATVTALDVKSADEFRRIPFQGSHFYATRRQWLTQCDAEHLVPLKKAFWYTWQKYKSNVEVIYAPLDKLYAWDRKFDVVLAGAIIEHISDPVSAIGAFAHLAKEAVIISMTEVIDSDLESMQPNADLSNPQLDFEWWKLSQGLYRRIFDNMGFDVEFTKSTAIYTPGGGSITRPTIIARRRTSAAPARPYSKQRSADRAGTARRGLTKVRRAISRLKAAAAGARRGWHSPL